ncbi:hypothetical protein [Trichothermofontia sp.]
MVNTLGKKRLEAVLAIVGCAASGGTAAATPTPCAETPKQLLLTAADILMYASIWKIYFEEDLSHKALLDMLVEIGLVSVAAVGTAYAVARASMALACEVTDWLGPMGWGTSALLSGSLAGLSGMAWAAYCDRRYCDRATAQGHV